jgi:hypothetical protein
MWTCPVDIFRDKVVGVYRNMHICQKIFYISYTYIAVVYTGYRYIREYIHRDMSIYCIGYVHKV